MTRASRIKRRSLAPETRAMLSVGLPRWARPRTAWRLGVVLLAACCMTLFLLVNVALADPPANPCGERGGGGNICQQDNPNTSEATKRAVRKIEKAEREKKEAKKRSQAAFDRLVAEKKEKQSLSRGVLSALDVRDRDGSPVAVYEVQADTGSWRAWDLKVQNFLVQFGFQFVLWVVCLTCWLLFWALSFSLAALLLKPVLRVSDVLYTNVLVQMGLPSLMLTFAGVVAAWHFFFGRASRGWGELFAALTISAVAIGALASPATLLLDEKDGAVGQARELSVEVAALTLADLDPGADAGHSKWQATSPNKLSQEISRPITDALVDVFVVRSSMLLSYGQTFDGKCSRDFRDVRVAQQVYSEALEEARDKRLESDLPWLEWDSKQLKKNVPVVGGWLDEHRRGLLDDFRKGFNKGLGVDEDDDDKVFTEIINKGPIKDFEAKCVKGSAATAKKASTEKSVGVIFLFIATLIVAGFVVFLVGCFLTAQFWIAYEAAVAKVALAVGVLPGPGRAWLWARAAAICKQLGLMVVSIAALAIFIIVIVALVETKEQDLPGGLPARFFVMDFAAAAGFLFRKKMATSVGGLTQRARVRMGNSPFGGAAPPISQPKSRGIGRTLAMAALLTGGAGVGGSYGARRLTRSTSRLVRGTVRTTGRTAGVMAKGVGITARVARASLGTSSGRTELRARLGRLSERVGTGLPPHVPGDAAGLRERMTRLRNERTARGHLATMRAAGAGRPAAGGHARPRPAAAGAARRAPGRTAAPTGAGMRRAAAAPRGGGSVRTPAPHRTPARTRLTPPRGAPPVFGPTSPVRRPSSRRGRS